MQCGHFNYSFPLDRSGHPDRHRVSCHRGRALQGRLGSMLLFLQWKYRFKKIYIIIVYYGFALRDGMHMSICAQHNCSICCHDREVVLTHEDVSRLLTMGHYEQTFARPSRHGHNLKELVFLGGECIFLKTGKCSVYYNRPTACRIFPMSSR